MTDAAALRGELMDELAFEAVFNADEALRDACRWVIWSASQALGCPSASIHELYLARGRGEFDATRFTVPAINVRASTYLTARQAFAAAIERDAGAVVFEIAKSEMAYTDQRPAEYTAVILAAALRSGWQGPVFLQGDHFQFNATKWRDDPDAEMAGLKDLTREAIGAGFLNIDIDSSTLVDLSQPGVAAQQAVNAANTVELTLLIRDLQPDGVVISTGGEIGEVGKSNSTEEELRAYLDGYYSLIHGSGIPGLSKVSIQTGTSHGGVALPDGSIAEVSIDFDTLRRLSTVAREEYGASRLRAARRQHAAGRGVPPLPGQRRGGDPPGHRLPEHPVRRARPARGCPRRDDELVPGQLRRGAQGRRDRRAVPVQDPQEGAGPLQAAALDAAGRGPGAASAPTCGLASASCSTSCRSAARATLVDRYVSPPALPRPLPPALGGAQRTAVSAGAAVFEDDGSGE